VATIYFDLAIEVVGLFHKHSGFSAVIVSSTSLQLSFM